MQTLGLLLDIDSIPWPAGLRAMMQMFNGMFNINCPRRGRVHTQP